MTQVAVKEEITLSTKICADCGNEISISANFCNKCRSKNFETGTTCPSCNAHLPKKNANFCPACGKRLLENAKIKMKQIIAPDGVEHVCAICRSKDPIDFDLAICPSCLNTFHFNHLANWILSNENCPICKTKLELLD